MTVVDRPWGSFETIDSGTNPKYKVKKIYVKPTQRFSLQYHRYRSEHWIVVQGDGTVTVGKSPRKVSVGDYIFIPVNSNHRMESGVNGITFIEVQMGSICEEDDIVRIEDDYGRVDSVIN